MGFALEQFPDWPAAMDRETALAYTGQSAAQLKLWERTGRVRFLNTGPHGAAVALREDLDSALRELFDSGGSNDDEIPFD